MRSFSPTTDITRFGTSVQLTRRGTLAVAKFWRENGDESLVTDAFQRIKNAEARVAREEEKRAAKKARRS